MKIRLAILLHILALLIGSEVVFAGLDDGLIAYYKFDGNAEESTGQYVDGILHGNATFKEGVIGQALYLDGNGDYVDIGNGLNLYGKYSISFWIKSEDLNRKYPGILAKYETNHYGPYDFDLHYNKANIWISDGHGGYSSIDSNTTIQQNKWTHIAYTVNYNKLRIYINGRLDITATIPIMTQNGDKVTIGRQSLMFSPYYDLEFKGYVDEVRIYDRELTATEIRLLSNKPSEHKINGVNTGWCYPLQDLCDTQMHCRTPIQSVTFGFMSYNNTSYPYHYAQDMTKNHSINQSYKEGDSVFGWSVVSSP